MRTEYALVVTRPFHPNEDPPESTRIMERYALHEIMETKKKFIKAGWKADIEYRTVSDWASSGW